MSLRVDWTPRAQRDLTRLDRPTRERVVNAVLKLAETNQGDVIKLAGKQPAKGAQTGELSQPPRPEALRIAMRRSSPSVYARGLHLSVLPRDSV